MRFWIAVALVGLALAPLLLLAWLFLLIAPRTFERVLLAVLPRQREKKTDGTEFCANHLDINQEDAPGELYIRRFYLTPVTWKRKIFLHRICRSDRDRDAHDHQWNFWSLILRGKYIEHLFHPNGCGCGDLKCQRRYEQRHAPTGTLLRNKAEHTHWVQIVKPVWSLVAIGLKSRPWGFWIMGEEAGVAHTDDGKEWSRHRWSWRSVPADEWIPAARYLKSVRASRFGGGMGES